MRAPPASNSPMIGARALSAMSWTLVIFLACASESEPPNTVKSFENTKTTRPLTVPQPVTTPSPGILTSAMPKSVQPCWTNMSNSSKEPSSRRSSNRSRAVSLPRSCCAAMRRSPPPIRADSRRSARRSSMVFIVASVRIHVRRPPSTCAARLKRQRRATRSPTVEPGPATWVLAGLGLGRRPGSPTPCRRLPPDLDDPQRLRRLRRDQRRRSILTPPTGSPCRPCR